MTRWLRKVVCALGAAAILSLGAVTASHAQWWVAPGGTVTKSIKNKDGSTTHVVTMPDGTRRVVNVDAKGAVHRYVTPPKPPGPPAGGAGNAKNLPKASDIRLKRDIAALGRLDNGLALYRFRYIWSDQVYVGVMAQEVAAIAPDAVVRGPDGYLRVDYGRLGLDLQTWEQWSAGNGVRLIAQ